jgi:hypothetical protein
VWADDTALKPVYLSPYEVDHFLSAIHITDVKGFEEATHLDKGKSFLVGSGPTAERTEIEPCPPRFHLDDADCRALLTLSWHSNTVELSNHEKGLIFRGPPIHSDTGFVLAKLNHLLEHGTTSRITCSLMHPREVRYCLCTGADPRLFALDENAKPMSWLD